MSDLPFLSLLLIDCQSSQAIIGVCRDLRGVTLATANRKCYCALFELLYPQFFPVFVRAAETWFDAPEVTTALLKFLQVTIQTITSPSYRYRTDVVGQSPHSYYSTLLM